MPTSLSRFLLPCVLLVGLAAGCAHGAGSGNPSPNNNRSIVTSEDLERSPGEPIENILMSKVSGIVVTRAPDGGIAIRIRGGSSISSSNEPLYIINGIAFQPGPEGSLTGINPYDIASIEVLKDAAATAMYGVRGANGVIVIKLKQGRQ
jgi:TonB-dependent SusC/RagA subfamily outer membrane receptor